ncbi:MAG TPA: glycosyltransferase, partial [Blastocatellia bacterium]|nr:glycosyltransferase [Blastocatellia bacterium]
MRVSIVGPAHPLRGGIATHVYLVHNELIQRGHEVQVISFKWLYPRLLFPGKTTEDTSRLAFNVNARPLLTPLGLPSIVRGFLAIRQFSPDAVLLQWWNPFFGPVIGTIARLCRIA